ncbi:MAG: aspartate-semialdehyde dehydrogenase [Atopobiaceae bacterium]|jgi:aspartate-semialdehyde dehydrogenase|uniref:aspartate-semialdehyde dehydrogenase n=1 Tax=Olsenella sp. AGMB03486 TaxID=3230364 RepID=UPI002A873CA0|nr:aspartate-semialdehyde dehydrogenase [Atopobiaceae bacterium]MCI6263458.1 aspartate-semialdehyde dehydrogenase [Olsenella sp.]MDD5844904.1 aspartate-semialdehyde dehydrogenase [Olsenella sp.]MDY3970261.1 aspartate-semialdehyde dehydrogenase [Atopobiaceae bacterium]
MAGKRVAILGATGVVGTQMRQCLEERNFPVSELVPLASAKSAGKTLTFKGEEVEVKEAKPEAFDGIDIVLGAAGDGIAKALLPEAAARGAVCVDNSHAFRLDPDVPLVVPEINPEDIQNHPRNIIANPNCATIIGLVPTYPLHKAAGLKRMIVSTYQAASGAGMPGLTELTRELKVLAEGGEVGDTSPFAYQLAMNLIPQIGSFKDEGYTSEEWKMQNEGRKIMHLPEVRVNCTCVRVPIMRSHSESITLEFENPLSPDEAREILSTAPGVKVVDDPANLRYPMPLDTSDQDLVFVGRIRRDLSAADGVNGLTFFCCGDQIRKGAATNAVQIAEYLV